MQPDVNRAKSTAFNINLRFLQLGLCLLLSFIVDQAFNVSCVQQTFQIINIMGIAMAVINLCAIIFEVTRKHHNKLVFGICYGINIVMCLVIIIFSALNFHNSKTCPTKTFLYIYYFTNIPLYLILSAMIMFMPFFWVQRFTNSPGSAVWPFLFFLEAYHTKYTVVMMLIGLFALTANVLTWATNGLALLNGVSTLLKKIIWVCFIISLSFTILNEVMALFIVFLIPAADFKRALVKTLVETFLLINAVDIAFWCFGFMSLNYENGDVVRDGLLGEIQEEKE